MKIRHIISLVFLCTGFNFVQATKVEYTWVRYNPLPPMKGYGKRECAGHREKSHTGKYEAHIMEKCGNVLTIIPQDPQYIGKVLRPALENR
jgi:hypothetical protein